MGAGQVFAVGSHLFPDEGDRIQPDDFHALVGQEEQFFGHPVENGRVGIVQIPLVAVEGRPDPATGSAPGRREKGKSAGVFIGENFPQGEFVCIGQFPVGIDEIKLFEIRVAGQGALGPEMLIGGVIEDQVDHQADARGA